MPQAQGFAAFFVCAPWARSNGCKAQLNPSAGGTHCGIKMDILKIDSKRETIVSVILFLILSLQ